MNIPKPITQKAGFKSMPYRTYSLCQLCTT